MKKKQIFTKEGLEEMGVRTSDLIDAAIDAGDLQEAKRLNHRMVEEFQIGHDGYLEWVTGLMSHIYRKYGDDALYEALHESFGDMFKPMLESHTQESLDVLQRVEMAATMIRGHAQPMKVVEDDEKITLMMRPCGSGGRLVQNNKYEPTGTFAKVKKAQTMTFSREDFPVYCTHCAIGEILAIEYTGAPLFAIEPAAKIGEQLCRFHVYKDPVAIPDEVYERFGKKKKKM